MTNNYTMSHLYKFQAFDTLEEMNSVVAEYNTELDKSRHETLNYIAQHSCKVLGVSHLKFETIAKGVNKSRRTVIRHINYLQEVGILSSVKTKRPVKGGYGANVYVINPIELRNPIYKRYLKKKKEENIKHPKPKAVGIIISKSKEYLSNGLQYCLKRRRKPKEQAEMRKKNILSYRNCPKNVSITTYAKYRHCLTDNQLSELVKTIKRPTKKANLEDSVTLEIINESIDKLIRYMKKGVRNKKKKVKNIYAYVYKIAEDLCDEITGEQERENMEHLLENEYQYGNYDVYNVFEDENAERYFDEKYGTDYSTSHVSTNDVYNVFEDENAERYFDEKYGTDYSTSHVSTNDVYNVFEDENAERYFDEKYDTTYSKESKETSSTGYSNDKIQELYSLYAPNNNSYIYEPEPKKERKSEIPDDIDLNQFRTYGEYQEYMSRMGLA